MKKGQILCVSGASTKLPAIYGATVALYQEKGIAPEILAGVSSGAITVLLASIKKFTPEVREAIVSTSIEDFFKVSPINAKGNPKPLTIGSRILRGKHSLGDQSNLKKILAKHFTEGDHEQMKASKVRVYVGAVSYNTGKIEYLPLHELSYSDTIKAVYASACIPVYTEGQEIDYQEIEGQLFYDGGVIDHIPSPVFAVPGVEELISVYSRPEGEELPYVTTEDLKKNVGKIFMRTEEIRTHNTSIEDEKLADSRCAQHKIENFKIFMPYKLTDKTYVSGGDLARAWYEIGYNATLEALEA